MHRRGSSDDENQLDYDGLDDTARTNSGISSDPGRMNPASAASAEPMRVDSGFVKVEPGQTVPGFVKVEPGQTVPAPTRNGTQAQASPRGGTVPGPRPQSRLKPVEAGSGGTKRYFVLKSVNAENVERSMQTGLWSTQVQTRDTLFHVDCLLTWSACLRACLLIDKDHCGLWSALVDTLHAADKALT